MKKILTGKSMSKHHIIIIGVNKASTTSVYNYLADHPDVCGATEKQTFFFLDEEYRNRLGFKTLYNYQTGFSDYFKLFQNCKSKNFTIEASPEYFFAPNTAERIAAFASDNSVKLILLLRDPVDRLVSLFHFGKQQGILDQNLSFEGYIDLCRNESENSNTSTMGYQTGFYSKFISPYLDRFGESMTIDFHEKFVSNPIDFMKRLSSSIGLNPDFYDEYDYKHFNKTKNIKSVAIKKVYLGVGDMLRGLKKFAIGRVIFSSIRKPFAWLYHLLNYDSAKKNIHKKKGVISQELLDSLRIEYKDDIAELSDLIGQRPPWKLMS